MTHREDAMVDRGVGRVSWAAVLVAAIAFGAAGVAHAKRTFVYVHDRQIGGGIYGFSLKKGNLDALPGSPWTLADDGGDCDGMCQTMAYSAKRKMLVTGGPNGITSWTVNKDGSLAASPGSPGAAVPGADVLGTGVVQIGKRVFVYASAFALDRVLAYELLPDGQFAAGTDAALPIGSSPNGLQTRKKLVFVVNEDTATVATWVAQKDGTLVAAPGSPLALPVLDFVFNPAPDPKGKLLYVYDDGDDDGGRIHAYMVSKKTGALTPVPGTPFLSFPVGSKNGLAVAKKKLLAVNYEDGSNDVQPFKIGKKGVITDTGVIIDSNIEIQAHTIDAKGKQFIAVSSDFIVVAKVIGKDGSLDALAARALPGVNANAVVVVKR